MKHKMHTWPFHLSILILQFDGISEFLLKKHIPLSKKTSLNKSKFSSKFYHKTAKIHHNKKKDEDLSKTYRERDAQLSSKEISISVSGGHLIIMNIPHRREKRRVLTSVGCVHIIQPCSVIQN